LCMLILGRAHQSHHAKHVLGSAVGGGWPLSQAQPWVANKSSSQPGSPSAGRQTPEVGRPWPGLTRPGPVRLARPTAATLTNTPLLSSGVWCYRTWNVVHTASAHRPVQDVERQHGACRELAAEPPGGPCMPEPVWPTVTHRTVHSCPVPAPVSDGKATRRRARPGRGSKRLRGTRSRRPVPLSALLRARIGCLCSLSSAPAGGRPTTAPWRFLAWSASPGERFARGCTTRWRAVSRRIIPGRVLNGLFPNYKRTRS
jgi:hypothetical protein